MVSATSSVGSTVFSLCAASTGSISSSGFANTAAIGSEIARIWPLRSVMVARCTSGMLPSSA